MENTVQTSGAFGVKIRGKIEKVLISILAVVLSFAASMVIIAFMGMNPVEAFKCMFVGALGSPQALSETMVKMTPLLFTGMSYALAARCGLTNLGMEGQLYVGALCTTATAVYVTGLPAFLHLPLSLLAGFVGGGAWGFLAGWLRVRFGASEIITTVMLNTVALNICDYMVCNPMNEATHQKSQTEMIQNTAVLPRLFDGMRLHAGFLLAIAFVFLFWLFLWKSKKGFEVRISGQNQNAARYSGININRNIKLVMFLAGGLGGLAGACEILGVQKMMLPVISPGYGFDGIAVALIGMTTPPGIVAGAFLFGVLRAGGNMMQMIARVPNSIISIISGLVIITVVASSIVLEKLNDNRLKTRAKGVGQ